MGVFVFLIFGLAPDQVLAAHVAAVAARLRGRRAPGAPDAPTPPEGRITSFDVNEQAALT